jgi:putative peptidoglycan lipid II flippase
MRKEIFKSYFILLIITLVLRILDVVKSLIVASKIGVSGSADVLFSLQLIPEYIVILLGIDTLKGVANSEYSSLFSTGSIKELKKSLSFLLKYLVICSFFLSIAIFIFREEIIRLLLPGLSAPSFEMAVKISVLIFPIFFVRSVTSLLQPYFNSQKKFYFPVLAQSFITILILIFVFLPVIGGNLIYNLAVALLIGNILYLVTMLYPALVKDKITYARGYDPDPISKTIISSCGAILLLSFVNQLFLFSRNYFASFFPEGSISAINYGATVPVFVTALTFTIVFGVLLTNLSTYFAEGKMEEAKKIFYDTFNILVFIYVPIVTFFIIFGNKILSLIYLRGNFSLDGVILSQKPFFWESLALLTFLTFMVPTSLFMARKNYKFLTITGSISYALGILLNYFFTNKFGFYGVSISTFAVSGMYGTMLFLKVFKIFPKSSAELIRSLKILLCGALTYLIVQYLKNYSDQLIVVENSIIPLVKYLSVAFILVLVIFSAFSYVMEPSLFKKVFSLIVLKIKSVNIHKLFRKSKES